jgi:hypothetical protein
MRSLTFGVKIPAIMVLLAMTMGASWAQNPVQGPAQTPSQASPQGAAERVCVGDICANSGKYNLGCDFAYAHPTDTDQQAAIYVCQFLNNFSQPPKFIRVGTAPGGKCGVIYLDVKCQ